MNRQSEPGPTTAADDTVVAVDIGGEEIHWDQDMSYGQYLHLDVLLDAQKPLTDEHDEMLFVIIHQATELWLKLSLHELDAAIAEIQADSVRPAFKMLSRIARIQAQLIQSWEVLSTLTPVDYLKFRDRLGASSGFQSYQYRLLEYRIGNKNPALAEVHRSHPEIYARLQDALAAPSLYDEVLALMARSGFELPADVLERDFSLPYAPRPEVEDAWLEVYRDTDTHWTLYELAEKLVDLEQNFQNWRFSHMKTVERIIGYRRGTGGSSGVHFLKKALDLRFFPEIWDVRTRL
ncbi:MAG TPA: tryptophan 2,3-dioxygenase [Acidimicrobiales bacterium]|nr:tryptophan 2,3-dioxygenase [Acidimicrobiales bacterium]